MIKNNYFCPKSLQCPSNARCFNTNIVYNQKYNEGFHRSHIFILGVRIKEIFKYSANAADNTMKVNFVLFIEDRV